VSRHSYELSRFTENNNITWKFKLNEQNKKKSVFFREISVEKAIVAEAHGNWPACSFMNSAVTSAVAEERTVSKFSVCNDITRSHATDDISLQEPSAPPLPPPTRPTRSGLQIQLRRKRLIGGERSKCDDNGDNNGISSASQGSRRRDNGAVLTAVCW